jgi:hypothetical protein
MPMPHVHKFLAYTPETPVVKDLMVFNLSHVPHATIPE